MTFRDLGAYEADGKDLGAYEAATPPGNVEVALTLDLALSADVKSEKYNESEWRLRNVNGGTTTVVGTERGAGHFVKTGVDVFTGKATVSCVVYYQVTATDQMHLEGRSLGTGESITIADGEASLVLERL